MSSFFEEIGTHGLIYLILAFLSFLNIIIPMSGSSTTTPLILILTGNPHYAIALSTWVLMLNTGIGAFIFRTNIRKEYVLELLPATLFGVVLGALLLLSLPDWLVTLVFFGFSVHFLRLTILRFLKVLKEEQKKPLRNILGTVATFVSSFLQGTGLSGGGMRVNYLYSQGLKVEEVRGVGNLLNFIAFSTASLVRLGDGQISFPEILRWSAVFVLYCFWQTISEGRFCLSFPIG